MWLIAGTKRADQRKMDDLREELCVEKFLMGRLVKSHIKWASQMDEDRLPSRYQETGGEGKEDCTSYGVTAPRETPIIN